jgi:hypothetical protein
MKKIIFLVLLATLMVVPAWAAVKINCTVVQAYVNGEWVDTDRVIIDYNAVGETNNVRAFALDVVLHDHNGSTPEVSDINDAALNADYWVYPGTIDINEAGEINDIGTPIADICDLPSDTLPGLDSNGVTIEMGSLYVGAANEPYDNNDLIELIVDDDCNIIITENVSRGGLVMEGAASKSDPCMPPETKVRIAPKAASTAAQWRAVGKPKCWLKFNTPRQCHGDADNAKQTIFNYWVASNDQQVVNAAWQLNYNNLLDGNGNMKTVNVGGKDVPLICADFDHTTQTIFKYRVASNDQGIVNSNWQQKNLPAADCDP